MNLINYQLPNDLPAQHRVVFDHARTRLNRVLHAHTSEIPLEITVTVKAFDGKGGILGQAGPVCGPTICWSRNGLPIRGVIEFDKHDMESMAKNGTLTDVVLHETLHVLGYGTLWSTHGVIKGEGGSDPQYVGWHGLAEYRRLSQDGNAQSVPVENEGGPGTRDGHWREKVFQDELGTGYITGFVRPLSRLTIASLADLGYRVDMSQADPYTLPPPAMWPLMAANTVYRHQHSQCPDIRYVDDLAEVA